MSDLCDNGNNRREMKKPKIVFSWNDVENTKFRIVAEIDDATKEVSYCLEICDKDAMGDPRWSTVEGFALDGYMIELVRSKIGESNA